MTYPQDREDGTGTDEGRVSADDSALSSPAGAGLPPVRESLYSDYIAPADDYAGFAAGHDDSRHAEASAVSDPIATLQTSYLLSAPPAPAPVRDPHPDLSTDWTYEPPERAAAVKDAPAEWGWRARVRGATGGLVSLSPARAEAEHRAAVDMIGARLPGSRTIVVANEKGGAGKTPTALILSALLAEYRREAVIAWDVNELRGTLGRRAEIAQPATTVTDLLAASAELARPEAEVGMLAAYLRRQPQGNLVLASSEDGNAMRQIGHAECDIVRQLLLRRYALVVCDTGNNAAATNFLYTVDSADVLVVPTDPSSVHLEVVRAMLRMLASRETTAHLVKRAVLVVTSPTGRRLNPDEERWFAERVGRVVHVPADPVIAEGGKLPIGALSEESHRAWTQVTAAVVGAALVPSPNDRAVGRRRAPERSDSAFGGADSVAGSDGVSGSDSVGGADGVSGSDGLSGVAGFGGSDGAGSAGSSWSSEGASWDAAGVNGHSLY